MKRTMLMLNIVIGLATLFMINQLNQLVPGGKFYQDMGTLEAVNRAVDSNRRHVQELLDEYVVCKSSQFCSGLTDARSKVLKVRPIEVAAVYHIVPDRTQEYLGILIQRQHTMDQQIVAYLDQQPPLNADFLLKTTEMRQTSRDMAHIVSTLITTATVDVQQKIRERIEYLQFTFIAIMISMWAFSALLTDFFLLKAPKGVINGILSHPPQNS